jgi:SAM-dependent methyltransferase
MDYDLKRYELFGWDYEILNPLTDTEADWYVGFAGQTGGPVLELACGTGRLLVRLAQAGYEVDGIDLSGEMLSLAGRRRDGLPVEVRSRIGLIQTDMARFAIDRRYGMVLIADNSFRELSDRKQQLSCLKCVGDHLRTDGKLLVTERRFDVSKLVDGGISYPWTTPVRHPETGETVSRKVEVRLTDNGKWIRGIMRYKVVGDEGERIEECRFEAPIMEKEDYVKLFAEAGFSTEAYANYSYQLDDGENPILCFVCSKRA